MTEQGEWAQMLEIEPRLRSLMRLAARGGTARDWSNIKSTLAMLVGWNAARVELRSSGLYETAYARLLSTFETNGGRF